VITIKYTGLDAAAGARLADHLRLAGLATSTEVQQGKEHIFIPVLSPQAEKDPQMQQAIIDALDNGQFIIPVLAQKTALPRLIEHLPAADLSKEEDLSEIVTRIQTFRQNQQHIVMKVHTPRIQAANRRVAVVLAFLALFMCGVGILLVGGGVAQFPQAEYNAVDTAEAATISAIVGEQIAPYVPRSTEDAIGFEGTLQAVATRYRPFLAATATAVAATAQP